MVRDLKAKILKQIVKGREALRLIALADLETHDKRGISFFLPFFLFLCFSVFILIIIVIIFFALEQEKWNAY